jgi:hypothetical protein
VTERVTLTNDEGKALEGWALNVSRGGVRAILEEKVVLGQKFEVAFGAEDALPRPGRIVWVQEEPDGVIVGIEFTGLSGTLRSAAPAFVEGVEAGDGVGADGAGNSQAVDGAGSPDGET